MRATVSAGSALKSQVVNGIAWAAATRALGQLVNWAITLVVLRTLRPHDYGLMAIVVAVTGLLQSLGSAGLLDAVVQARTLDRAGKQQAFGLVLLANGIFIVVLLSVAGPLARFYAMPDLAPLLCAASLSFVPTALGTMSRAQLQQDLALKHTSRVEMLAAMVAAAGTLGLALAGAGVWSLMAGFLLTQLIMAVGYYRLAPYAYMPTLSGNAWRHLLRFGSWRMAEHLLWVMTGQIDIFLAGKLLPQAGLDLYAVARTLSALPLSKLALVIKPVWFPAFSAMQNDRPLAVTYLRNGMHMLGFIAFPVLFGIAAVAPELVAVVLGPRWAGLSVPLSLLSLGMLLRPAGMLIGPFLLGLGEMRASFLNSLQGLLVFAVAYSIGSQWGLVGLCVGSAVAYPVQFVLLARRTGRVAKTKVADLLRPLLQPLVIAALMFVSVSALRAVLPPTWPDTARLALLIGLGVSFYAAAVFAFCRPVLTDALRLLRP